MSWLIRADIWCNNRSALIFIKEVIAIDKELLLAEADMLNLATWQKVLIQLGVSRADFSDIKSVRVTCKTIYLQPS